MTETAQPTEKKVTSRALTTDDLRKEDQRKLKEFQTFFTLPDFDAEDPDSLHEYLVFSYKGFSWLQEYIQLCLPEQLASVDSLQQQLADPHQIDTATQYLESLVEWSNKIKIVCESFMALIEIAEKPPIPSNVPRAKKMRRKISDRNTGRQNISDNTDTLEEILIKSFTNIQNCIRELEQTTDFRNLQQQPKEFKIKDSRELNNIYRLYAHDVTGSSGLALLSLWLQSITEFGTDMSPDMFETIKLVYEKFSDQVKSIELNKERINIATFADQLHTSLTQKASAFNLSFSSEIEQVKQSLPKANVVPSPTLVTRWIDNVLSNIQKAGATKIKLHIGLSPTADNKMSQLEIVISDNGPGFPAENFPITGQSSLAGIDFDQSEVRRGVTDWKKQAAEQTSTDIKVQGTGIGLATLSELLKAFDTKMFVGNSNSGAINAITIPLLIE